VEDGRVVEYRRPIPTHLSPREHPGDSPQGLHAASGSPLCRARPDVERPKLQLRRGRSEVGDEPGVLPDDLAVRLAFL